jgi:hypothetical protein
MSLKRMTSKARERDLTWVIATFFLLFFGLTIHSHANSWNDLSRLATVEALVHHKTWAIEDTALGNLTGDRIYLVADATTPSQDGAVADTSDNGHFYSDKPPVLSFLTAGVYRVLHAGLGISLLPKTCDPEMSTCYCFALLCPYPPDWAYYLLTLIMVSAPSALMLALFYRSRVIHTPMMTPQRSALVLTLLLGLGTLVLPYSLVFNNHVPAAACLMVGFYAWLQLRFPESQTPHRIAQYKLFWAGFAFALAFTFDLWTGPFLGLFGLHALWRFRHRAWPFLVGALLPITLLAGLDWHILGDPLPPQLHPEGFNYPGSAFPSTMTGTRSASHIPSYAFRMLVGDHGWFAFTPLMGWAVFSLGRCLHQRKHPLRSEALTISAGSLVTVLYFALFTNNFGGASYGPRWVVAMTPLLFFFIQITHGDIDQREPQSHPTATHWRRLIFTGLALLSLASAWRGALDPWTQALPLLRLEDATSAIARYIQSDPTLTDAVIYVTPPETVKSASPGWRAIRGLSYWSDRDLTGLSKHAREFDAASGLLPLGDPNRPLLYVIREAHNKATIARLEAIFPQGDWGLLIDGKGVYRVPTGENRARLTSSPIFEEGNQQTFEFDEKIRLLAYTLSYGTTPNPQPGTTLRIQLVWQAMAPMEHRYTAFVHFMDEAKLWAQDDHQPGYTTRPIYPTDHWFPGEILLDEFQLTIPLEAPAGTYQLNTGFYVLATLQRLPRSDTVGDIATLATISIEN